MQTSLPGGLGGSVIWGVGVVSPPGPDVGDAVPEEPEVGLEVVLGVGTTVLLELEDGEEVGCPVLELVAISVGEEVGTVVGYSVGTSVGTSVGAVVNSALRLGLGVGSTGEGVPGPAVGLPLGSNVGVAGTGAELGLPLVTVGPGDDTWPEGLLVGPSYGPPAGAGVGFPGVGPLVTGAALGLPLETVGPGVVGALIGAPVIGARVTGCTGWPNPLLGGAVIGGAVMGA